MLLLNVVETLSAIPTSIFLFVVVSQLVILIWKPKRKISEKHKPSLSVLIPAHNEGRYIKNTIDSVLNSGYPGYMEIIVIDDGSVDNTPEILKRYENAGMIRSIRTNHIGKSRAMNRALQEARNEITVVIDGDSIIERGSLDKLVAPFEKKDIAATAGAIKVANKKGLLTPFQRIEYLYFSFYKTLCDRIDGNIFTNGTLSAFRTKVLKKLRGFSPEMLSEDIDIALRIIKMGYKIRYVDSAITYTNVPEKIRSLIKQRARWTHGTIQVFKKHKDMYLKKKYRGSGLYSLPVISYYYFHSLVIGGLLVMQIILGYLSYFYYNGTVFSFGVLQYFFFWFSIFGILNLAYNMATGSMAFSFLAFLNIIVVALTYALYVYSLIYFKERPGIKDLVVFIFLFPYWLVLMLVQAINSTEWVFGKWNNWWNK